MKAKRVSERATTHDGTTDGLVRRTVLVFSTPWGWAGISETAKGIDAIALPQASKRTVEIALGAPTDERPRPHPSQRLQEARTQLVEFFRGQRHRFTLPLDVSKGTAFQRAVWRTLQLVPYGKLRSYQWVALRVGGRRYARAVGGAVGANPLPVVIPCHRIVAQDASLGGFSCGLPMKRKLLALEGSLAQLQRGRS